MYYMLVILAAALSAFSFYFNGKVEKQCENGLDTAMLFSTVVRAEILLFLLIAVGGKMQFSTFSFICAFVHAMFLIAFSFLNLKALNAVDLSKYSMFTMLGGMMLPFAFGILFFNEKLTAGKLLCCALVTVALYINSCSGKISKKAIFYLIAVFFVNGSFGVICSVHQNVQAVRVDTLRYMCLQSLIVLIFGCIWLGLRKISKEGKKIVKNKRAYINMLLYGICYGGTEIILLFTIKAIPTSVQYAIMTGGVIIFSTIISMLIGENRNIKSLIPVLITFAGLLLLMI